MNEENFVKEQFMRYYGRCALAMPEQPQQREFGFGTWDKKIEYRHLAFATEQELRGYLQRNTPLYVSYSTAFYEFPAARPMQRKNWLGAELVFDMDIHGCARHDADWVCDACLSAIKGETIKLVEEFLVPDFGFSRGEMAINFSGNRGYHVHVANDAVKQMSGSARREIIDYVNGTGLDLHSLGFRPVERTGGASNRGKNVKSFTGAAPETPGWAGRIARFAIAEIGRGTPESLERMSLSKGAAKKIIGRREGMLAALGAGGWGALPHAEEFLHAVLRKSRVDTAADEGVTCDVTKLIRMPGTLHGSTGLLAKRIGSIDDFDPLSDACALGSAAVRVRVARAPKMRIGAGEFGPFEDAITELPMSAAVYLMCKRKAVLA
jgi:DNA primase small subunit